MSNRSVKVRRTRHDQWVFYLGDEPGYIRRVEGQPWLVVTRYHGRARTNGRGGLERFEDVSAYAALRRAGFKHAEANVAVEHIVLDLGMDPLGLRLDPA